jgi:hypothetical protein
VRCRLRVDENDIDIFGILSISSVEKAGFIQHRKSECRNKLVKFESTGPSTITSAKLPQGQDILMVNFEVRPREYPDCQTQVSINHKNLKSLLG